MNLPDWAVFLGVVLSPILSFAGLVLGLLANDSVQRALKKKTNAEAHDVNASAADRLVDTALGLNEPLRQALEEERKIYRQELANERRLRHEELGEERRLRIEELEQERGKRRELEAKFLAMTREMQTVKRRNAELTEWVGLLVGQVQELGHSPMPDPGEKRA